MEAGYDNSQPVIDISNKSGTYAPYAETPYSPHQVDRCERSLHHTNRSQYDRDEDHHKHWFVTTNAHLRECFAEFLGTFVMICFGMGVNNQVVLGKGDKGTWLSINMAWGIAILMGVYISEGVSGAHMNPAVTLAHCVYGRLAWRKLPGYVLSQSLGAFMGACAIYLLDYQKISKFDPDKTIMQVHFATYPNDEINNLTAFYTETLATAILLLCIYAITDQHNRSPGTVGTPFAFALMIMALGMSFGMNTGYAMNPARDFGPRLFTYIVGYGSKVWTANGCYFLIPIFGPLVGGVIGAGLYEILVQSVDGESPPPTQPFPRKVRISTIEDSSGQHTSDQTPYADFPGSAYAPDIRVSIDRESPQLVTNPSDYRTSGETGKRRRLITKNAHLRECLAEFLATTIAIAFGLGGISQAGLWGSEYGGILTISLGWGVAVMIGTFVADSVSGAHIISVITVTNAVYGRMPWWKVPGYMVAQMLGAIVGTALIYVLNYQKIRREDPEKESMHHLFITYARPGVSNYTAFYTEVLACASIMLASYAIKDQRNCWPGKRGTPFTLALLVTAISCCFSANSALGMSPNRDFGPRFFMYLAGYHQVFTEDSCYFWIPIVAPLIGGIIGAGLYILFVEMQHPEPTHKQAAEREMPMLTGESM
ncbi:hypothetical protein JM18_006173 [Phytophthora kernoviae]|uniref:Aquaporin n=2 Tax=Phytophthora kernoviae TaxID=325452 RepID=A0A921SFL7_9STRA|nr:hypothetical protein G195_007576 [Phytophthora kernoviae 00238/432]KAG2522381.1 hypothetical protein JM18_006173 [Phytophthora kernoviae]